MVNDCKEILKHAGNCSRRNRSLLQSLEPEKLENHILEQYYNQSLSIYHIQWYDTKIPQLSKQCKTLILTLEKSCSPVAE